MVLATCAIAQHTVAFFQTPDLLFETITTFISASLLLATTFY
jgi:hypothetical protein